MFRTTHWLLVPATTGTNEVVFRFLNEQGGGDDWQQSVRCVDGSRTVVHDGWAIYDYDSLLRILRSARAKQITFRIFKCEEGETHGEPWQTEWEAGKPVRRPRRRSGAAAFSAA